MASFRLYNIQLLPLNTSSTTEVGTDGYRRFFSLIRDAVTKARREKFLIGCSFKLPHDTYFAPYFVFADEKFAHGTWVKYQKAETIVDLYTSESLYTAPEGATAVSNNYSFRFVFDYESHRLAIEELGGRLPSANILVKALQAILRPIADEGFPDYILTVNLVSKAKVLEDALAEAKGFRRVDVSVTFPNGHELSQRLREMRENNVHIVKAEASSEKDALMPNFPDFILEMVRAATDYGRAQFTYFRKDKPGKQVYSSEAYPEKINLRVKKGEHEASFIERVFVKLRGPALEDAPVTDEK